MAKRSKLSPSKTRGIKNVNKEDTKQSSVTSPAAPVNAVKKDTWVSRMAQTPWYIIVTLIMSVFGAAGGIPGILQLRSLITDRPILKYHSKGIVTVPATNTDSPTGSRGLNMLILSGSIENTGKKPLSFGDSFGLKMLLEDGSTVETFSGILPKALNVNAGDMEAKFTDINDLQTVYKLLPEEPITGTLVFYFKPIRRNIATPTTLFTISRQDHDHHVYSDTFHFGFQKAVAPTILLQNGLRVTVPVDSTK